MKGYVQWNTFADKKISATRSKELGAQAARLASQGLSYKMEVTKDI